MTQNAASWDYADVMCELNKQSNKKLITIQVVDQTYNSIRECDTDICDVAENLGFKADNIKNVKDHVFYNEHNLDWYDSGYNEAHERAQSRYEGYPW